MLGKVCLLLSLLCLFSTVISVVFNGKMRRKNIALLDRPKILFAGIALTSTILFIPVYVSAFKETTCGVLETLLMSFHNMIRLFVVDASFDTITDNVVFLEPSLAKAYSVLFSFLFVSAPLLTFGFVLSFFKNISSYWSYLIHFKSELYIFSKLNPQSVALAESLDKKANSKRRFIFTGVEKQDESNSDLLKRIEKIDAVYFNLDITSIAFNVHSKKSETSFFIIGDNDNENIIQGLKIAKKYKTRDKTNLYVFSTLVEAELLMIKSFESEEIDNNETATPVKIKIRRIDAVSSLVIRNLYEKGFESLFESAYEEENKGVKKISALVVGMGRHGECMTKALSWFCQMDGYELEVNSCDIDECANEKFITQCPELMDEKHNGMFDVDGEAKYKITIHNSIDVETIKFSELITSLPRVTYIFVALGNDEKNIATAVKLRTIYARYGYYPVIQAVVYDSEKTHALKGIKNFKGQEYNIDFIGDYESSYSESVIIGLDVENEALSRHLEWGDEKDFWQYDYNYRSSVASAVHKAMKIKCKIPEIELPPSERKDEKNIVAIRKLEHCRWNAYMRSIGYVFSGKIDKSTRNDLAKMHHLLVPFDQLPYEEQIKDDD